MKVNETLDRVNVRNNAEQGWAGEEMLFARVGLAGTPIFPLSRLSSDDMSLGAERLRGIALGHRDWLFADGGRTRLRAQWRELFKTFDAVICPIMPTSAFPHDHSEDQEARRIKVDGKDIVYPDMLAWPGIATLPGLPSTAIPTGFAPDGLPVGVQIVGPWLEDRTPLKLAELIEREFGGFVPPPTFDD